MKQILATFLLSSFLFSACAALPSVNPSPSPTTATQQAPSPQKNTVKQNVLGVDTDTGPQEYELEFGKTALDLLKNSHTLGIKQYAFGEVVESIDGIAGGTDGRYWLFYVNGAQAQVGAGAYVLKPNDVIEWKLLKENEQ